jgi:hypothetical protein
MLFNKHATYCSFLDAKTRYSGVLLSNAESITICGWIICSQNRAKRHFGTNHEKRTTVHPSNYVEN